MHLFHHELVEGPLDLIVQHLPPQDSTPLQGAAGAHLPRRAPVQQELLPGEGQLASFNTWLCQRIAAGAGAVQAVRLVPDEHGRTAVAACHLARCGTSVLALQFPSPALLEAACTIGSLTSLELIAPECPLDPLGALRQLQSLQLEYYPIYSGPGDALAWRPSLPALTRLLLRGVILLTISLDGCGVLREVKVTGEESARLALTASQPLPQLTRLELCDATDLAVPWQQLAALRELVVRGRNEGGLLKGATHLMSLSSLHIETYPDLAMPPGDWLASVTRLVLAKCNYVEGPEDLAMDWPASMTGIAELVLWASASYQTQWPQLSAKDILTTFKWLRWAAGQPRLRRVEVRASLRDKPDVSCKAARVEGEGVEAMLQRAWWGMAAALLPPGN